MTIVSLDRLLRGGRFVGSRGNESRIREFARMCRRPRACDSFRNRRHGPPSPLCPNENEGMSELDWGYNLLSPTEQTVLRRIAIFRATFTLDSALAVVVGPAISVENAIDAMANLVAKSLLSVDSTGDTVLYRLLEATRMYATERLAAGNEVQLTARRHAEHHLSLIETAPT